MSKVKIQGNASGTGVLTVTAPNTSTDRTITLPDSTGTLLTADGDGSGLTGVGVDGISSSADATAIKIDSSERVAIGNTDAGNYYSSADNLVVYDATQHAGITIASGGTDKTGNIYFADGTSGNAEYEGYIEYNHNGNAMSIGANHTTKIRIDSDGLKFNSDTASANALHDYEEGSHSASWTTGNSGSISMARSTMGYVKVGRVVTITGECEVGSVSSPNGGLRVSLPFAIASHTSERNMSFITRAGSYHTDHYQTNPPIFIGHAGTGVIEGIYERDDASFIDYNPKNSDAIWFCFSYFTDS